MTDQTPPDVTEPTTEETPEETPEATADESTEVEAEPTAAASDEPEAQPEATEAGPAPVAPAAPRPAPLEIAAWLHVSYLAPQKSGRPKPTDLIKGDLVFVGRPEDAAAGAARKADKP